VLRNPVRAEHLNLDEAERLPMFLTPDETASLLRTSRKAIYAMAERDQLPGVVRLGRRLLFHREELLEWLRQKSASSPRRER
jgi:excisionase family DNA binding protein